MLEGSRVGLLNLCYFSQYVLLILLIFPGFRHIQGNLMQIITLVILVYYTLLSELQFFSKYSNDIHYKG